MRNRNRFACVFGAALALVMLWSSACALRPETAVQKDKKLNPAQLWLIFVETDFNYSGYGPVASGQVSTPNLVEACGQGKFNKIWKDVGLIMDEALKEARNSPVSVEILRFGSGTPEPLLASTPVNFAELREAALEKVYRQDREAGFDLMYPRAKSAYEEARRAHATQVDQQGNNVQDVVAAIRYLPDHLTKEYPQVRAIFVSDMLHYTSNRAIGDPSYRQINLANTSDRGNYRDFVRSGRIGDSGSPLTPLDYVDLEVWTLPIERCRSEDLGQDPKPDWGIVYPDLKQIWSTVFETRLGAKQFYWEQSDLSGLLTRPVAAGAH